MKQLLKTTLLAATIAATCGSAVAGTITTTKSTYSTEGLSVLASTATITTNNLMYTLGANYIAGDKLNVSVTAGALATGFSFPSEITSVTTGTGGGTIVFSRINTTADSAKYRVASITSGMTSTGAVLDFKALSLKASAVATGAVSATFVSTEFGGSATDIIDSGTGNTKTVADTKSQLTAIAAGTKLDAIIDVKQERKAFLVGLNDEVKFTIGDDTTLSGAAAWTSSTVVMTVKGGESLTFGSSKGTTAFNKDTNLLTVSYTGGVTNDTITLTPATGTKAVALEPQSFDMTANYVFGAGATAKSFALGNTAAGEWKLNGAMVNIPYMPYSPSASQIMYITNSGSQTGDIVVNAFDEKGNSWPLGVVGQAKGNTVTKITELVRKALAEEGFTAGKLSITITVNAPAEDITVYAAYNAGSVRGFVNTSQYKGK